MTIHKHCYRFAVAAVAAAAVLASGAPAGAGELDGVTLRVGTWGGTWRGIQKRILVPRMEAKGAKVVFVAGSPQANLAKLIAAKGSAPPFDVMEIIDAILPSMMEGGFLQKIDLSLVPNTKHLAKGQYDEMKVATWITQEGICYNERKFKQLGIPAPKTYKDLANPKLSGRVQIPDIVSGGGLAAVAGISFASGGDLKNIKPGLATINSLKALKFWKRGSEALTQLKSGDIYAAVIHAGWCVRAVNAKMPVAFTHPVINGKTRGVVKQGWMGIMKGSRNAKAAAMWINEFISTDFLTEFAKKKGVVPENLDAVKNLNDDPVLKKIMLLDPAAISRMLRIDYSKVNISDWYDQWNRTVSR